MTDDWTPPDQRLAHLRDTLARRATTGEVIPAHDIEDAATDALELAVEHDTGGWPNADAAYRYAAALDATAHLARYHTSRFTKHEIPRAPCANVLDCP